MTDAFDKISKVWTEFPIEFKNSTLYNDVNKLKTTFENKKHFFGSHLTRIVIIGNVSTGKSALINSLLGDTYFETSPVNGTVAFFYCSLSEKNYEYFTVNDCPIEYKDIESLKTASRLNDYLPDYFDENSVIKVYLKQDGNKILDRKTVIIDCPGFGHDEKYDKEIEKHCSNADMFIFLFRIDEPATPIQKEVIKKLRDTEKKPICFYVYNKCDLPEFNENMKKTLCSTFYELFGKQYAKNLIENDNLLYFVSAAFPDKFEDYARLTKEIMTHKDVYLHRYAAVQSKLSDEVNIFREILMHFESDEKEKISSLKRLKDMSRQILDFVNRRIENCQNNLHLAKIFEIMVTDIYDFDDKCDKHHASIMISKIEEIIKNSVNEFVENDLKNTCIDPINRKLQNIRDDTNGNININDIELRIPRDHLVIPPYRNLKYIFRWFEFGDKTSKVKKSYVKFIESEAIRTQINEAIKEVYNTEFSNIRMYINDLLDISSKENITSSENRLGILINYENDVDENNKLYNLAIINRIQT